MSIQRNSSNLHDDTTGLLTGYVNPITGKEVALDAAALLRGPAALYDLPAPASMSGTTEVVLAQFLIPAGVLGVLDRLEMRMTASKSGTSETITFRVRVGTAGTIADTQVTSTTGLLSTTGISAGALLDYRRTTETALQRLGNGLHYNAYGGQSTVAKPAAIVVGDMDDADYYVSITAASSAAVETVTLDDLIARLTPAV